MLGGVSFRAMVVLASLQTWWFCLWLNYSILDSSVQRMGFQKASGLFALLPCFLQFFRGVGDELGYLCTKTRHEYDVFSAQMWPESAYFWTVWKAQVKLNLTFSNPIQVTYKCASDLDTCGIFNHCLKRPGSHLLSFCSNRRHNSVPLTKTGGGKSPWRQQASKTTMMDCRH